MSTTQDARQRFARQVVTEVLTTVGVRSNPSDRELAAENVLALLSHEAACDFSRPAPVEATAVAETPLVGCAICGGKRVRIRGRFPRDPEREVCPTCLAERMEQIQEISGMEYGAANVS